MGLKDRKAEIGYPRFVRICSKTQVKKKRSLVGEQSDSQQQRGEVEEKKTNEWRNEGGKSHVAYEAG